MINTFITQGKIFFIPKNILPELIYEVYSRLYQNSEDNKKRYKSFELQDHEGRLNRMHYFGHKEIDPGFLSQKKFIKKAKKSFKKDNQVCLEVAAISQTRSRQDQIKGLISTFFSEQQYALDLYKLLKIITEKRSPLARIQIFGKREIFFNPRLIEQVFAPYTPKITNTSFLEDLVNAGIPEEFIVKNHELWVTLKSIEQNQFRSKNQTYYMKDAEGKDWFLKFTQNKERAFLESAANYYLSQSFGFIMPGKHPEPFESNGVYLLMQKSNKSLAKTPKPLSYWLHCFAMFHREAKSILKSHGIIVPEASFRPAEMEEERYHQIRKRIQFPFDRKRLEDDITYLKESKNKTLIHNDVKPEHLDGEHLDDLGMICNGEPGVDLPALFMIYNVPIQKWDECLRIYLRIRGIRSSEQEELNELWKGIRHGANVIIQREIISSALRIPQEQSVKKLEAYAHWLTKL